MLSREDQQQLKADMVLPWVITGSMLLMLFVYILICRVMGDELQQHFPEAQRVLIRSLLYFCAIAAFPLTNLVRFIQVRLNQTMPGDNPAKNRYLLTIIVSMALIESIGVFGFIMFLLGDDYNTLYIFTGMSMLGLYLYRPKPEEYARIRAALTAKKNETLPG